MIAPALAFAALLLSGAPVPTTLPEPAPAADGEARLLRFPHIQGDKVAFVYGGDIWTTSAQGGTARRLTSFDEGFELFPRISPDGEWIAFSGEYTGSRQIYVVPYDGGVPRQLTYYPDVGTMPPRGGYDNLPIDWAPDGKRLLIRTNRTPYGQRVSRYYWVDPWNGGLEVPLQIPEGGPASLSPDGTKLAYCMISREWRTWKRYRAGRAQDVWIYDLAADTVERVTEFEGTDNFPLWLGERLYFTSDRTGTLNLYRYDLATSETVAVTDYTDFDVLFPSRGQGGVIFQKGGRLHVMDAGTEAVRTLSIQLADDRPWLRPSWHEAKDGGIAGYDISPSAKRAVVEFRGELFDVPAEKGRSVNLTGTPGRREHSPSWAPDGKHVAYLAEDGDDYELFVRSMVDGAERQLTEGTGAWIEDVRWAPNSESILFADKANRLSVVDVESGAVRVLDSSQETTVRGASWSGDSSWVTYLKSGLNGYDSVWICPLEGDGGPVQVTTDHYDDGSPAFDPGGDYLYFTSWRDFDFGDRDFEGRLYALLLREDVESPVAPENDVEEAAQPESEDDEEDADAAEDEDEDDGDEDGEEDDGEEEPDPLEIDLEGLSERLVALPGSPGTYWNLEGIEGGFVFVEGGDLKKFDLDEREAETILEGVGGYELTPDHGHVLYRSGRELCIAKLAPGQKVGKNPVQLGDVRVRVEPRVEWEQMYVDAWRIMRDWFYDPQMHGVDWLAMREKYRPLVAHAAHRDDLDFLLGELVGELNAGHTYVLPGDSPRVERIPVGVLGAELEAAGELYRIAKIFQGRGWNANERSPLAVVGVDASVGDYLVSIDGEPVTTRDNPYRLLEHTVGVDVTLELSAQADGSDPREVIVRPVASETRLRYLDWVANNRRIVDELSGGRIGYVHVPNTAVEGHRELWEGFTPQARVKDAMIIDDRYNGGGFIPADMIHSIASPVLNYWSERGTQPQATPGTGFDGPMVMLINGYSSSGGDAFPFYFRKLGLGKLMGKTTWGGLIGYSGSPGLVDGGGLAVPSFSFLNVDGEWDVEAVGVAPDIEVFDDPTLIQAGREPMLEAAVQHLLEELEREPKPERPATPPGPDRSR